MSLPSIVCHPAPPRPERLRVLNAQGVQADRARDEQSLLETATRRARERWLWKAPSHPRSLAALLSMAASRVGASWREFR